LLVPRGGSGIRCHFLGYRALGAEILIMGFFLTLV
jgi:hypothetical protein